MMTKRTVRFSLDVLVWTLATPLAFLTRHDGSIPPDQTLAVLLTTLVLLALKLPAHRLYGLHRQMWHKIGFHDLQALLYAVVTVGVVATGIVLIIGPELGVSRSIPLIDGLYSLLLLVGVRAAARYLHERRIGRGVKPKTSKRVLIVGAGEAGTLIMREMLRHPDTGLKPVAFLDDDPSKTGRRIATIPVAGTTADLGSAIGAFRVDEVLIAMPSADGRLIRSIVDKTMATGVKSRIIPGVYELLSGRVSINRIREVEVEDLLRRPPVELNMGAIMGYIEGKRVMVTGAGGSIGSELIRQICSFRPKELILLGRGENSIYGLERELERTWPEIPYHSVIGAVQHKTRLDAIFERYQPQVIFHAAAHKHVPLMELNPEEAVFNNIIGSKNLVQLARRYSVSHFVNISTDKAVNPTSVMGASKRMVEYIVQSAARQAKPNQVFVSVRFGNVLGSRGSVVPVFKQQIQAGGPVMVTHPDMLRYFMTIPEASQLVLQAAGQGKNGEIYILDMGEPVRIVDLARDLIRLSGLEPDIDIQIEFTGSRPGEKLFEELMTSQEREGATDHEKIFVAKPHEFSEEDLERTVIQLREAALRSDGRAVRDHLSAFIQGCNFEYSK